MKEVLHILTAILAALLLALGGATDRDGTAPDLAAWTISQATGSYDTAQKRGAELSADVESGASADGPGEPVILPDFTCREHGANRDAGVWQSNHSVSDARAKWSLPPATAPPFS